MSNKVLSVIFIILLLIYAATKFFEGDQDQSFDTTFIQLDTATVNRIVIHPKLNNQPFELYKKDGNWNVVQGAISSKANYITVQSMLRAFSNIQIQRIIAKSKERWSDYEVDEDNGLRIEVYNGAKKIADFIVGRFNFNQQARSATSYIRRNGEDDIYALDGFLSMTLNQSFDALRDKTLLDIKDNMLEEIEIIGTSIQNSISKNNGIWIEQSGRVLDSVMMAKYVRDISNIKGGAIADNINVDQLEKIGSVAYNISNDNTTTIEIFLNDANFILASSENDNLFSSDSSGVYRSVWTNLVDLLE